MPTGSRPSNGRFSIFSVPKACPRLASVVFTRGAVLVTSTITVCPRTCMVMFSVAGLFTISRTFSCFRLANPAAVTVTTYVAGGSCRNW